MSYLNSMTNSIGKEPWAQSVSVQKTRIELLEMATTTPHPIRAISSNLRHIDSNFG